MRNGSYANACVLEVPTVKLMNTDDDDDDDDDDSLFSSKI